MVVRLFVQPDEGKHWIVPKRHEPLAANATLQNSVIASTALAAGYTSYARNFHERVGYRSGLSVPALLIKSSARAGVWCTCVGAAVNWYYHYAFTGPVVQLSGIEYTPWKVWERTDKYTVDDGLLSGAGLGLASAVLMRRIPISWWTKFVGMGYLGAFTGVATSHAWFHHKGERQPAVAALEEWHKRRNLEFHWVYWNKVFMSKLSPAAQGYVVLNGVFKSNSIPEEAYQTPEKFGIVGIAAAAPAPDQSTTTDSTTAHGEAPAEAPYEAYYIKPYDPTENLRNINVQKTREKMGEIEDEKKNLLKESEYLLNEIVKRQYAFCHNVHTEEDERQRCQREIQILETCYSRVRSEADRLETRLLMWETSLQQKAAWAAETSSGDAAIERWTPALPSLNPARHAPTWSIAQVGTVRDGLVKDISDFEAREKTATGPEKRNLARDLDDARMLLRAADGLVSALEKHAQRAEGARALDPTAEPQTQTHEAAVEMTGQGKEEKRKAEGKAAEDAAPPPEDDKAKEDRDSDMEASKP